MRPRIFAVAALLASSLLVSAQRLLRKLCDHCKDPIAAPAERLLHLGVTEQELSAGPTRFRSVATQTSPAAIRASKSAPIGAGSRPIRWMYGR